MVYDREVSGVDGRRGRGQFSNQAPTLLDSILGLGRHLVSAYIANAAVIQMTMRNIPHCVKVNPFQL